MTLADILVQKKKQDWFLKHAAEEYNPGMPDWAVQELKRRETNPAPIDNPPPKSTFYQDAALTGLGYGGAGYGAHQIRKRVLGKDENGKWVYDTIRKRQADARKSIDNLQTLIEKEPELAGVFGNDTIFSTELEKLRKKGRVPTEQQFSNLQQATMNKARRDADKEYLLANPKAKSKYVPRVASPELTKRYMDYQKSVDDMKRLEVEHPIAARRLRDLFKKQEYGRTDISRLKQLSDFIKKLFHK